MRAGALETKNLEETDMFYESGIFPLFAAETEKSTTTSTEGPIQTGGETPPPPDDPPKG